MYDKKKKKKKIAPPVGLEPTTFELEVQRATIAPRGLTGLDKQYNGYTLQT